MNVLKTMLLVMLFLISTSFSAVYYYDQTSSVIFNLEGLDVELSRVFVSTHYNQLSNSCELDSTSGANVYTYPVGAPSTNVFLQEGQSTSFVVSETATNTPENIVVTLSKLNHNSVKQCSNPFDPSSCYCTHPGVPTANFKVIVNSAFYCSDPDGVNAQVYGTVSHRVINSVQQGNNIDIFADPPSTLSDSCSSQSIILEAICGSSGITTQSFSCASSTEVCYNGACNPTQPFCSDSDGSNSNVAVRGTVSSGTKHPQTGAVVVNYNDLVDTCVSTSTVREHFCNSANAAVGSNINCPTGTTCSNGACVSPGTTCTSDNDCSGGKLCNTLSGYCVTPVLRCFEDDNGQNIQLTGTTTQDYEDPIDGISFRSDNQQDICVNSATVKEYYCSGSTRASADLSCPTGQACTNGRCVTSGATSENFCTDADNGQNLATTATVRAGTRNPSTLAIITETQETDVCANTNTVREYYCSGSTRASADVACSSGEVCSSGRCVPQSTSCRQDNDCSLEQSCVNRVCVRDQNKVSYCQGSGFYLSDLIASDNYTFEFESLTQRSSCNEARIKVYKNGQLQRTVIACPTNDSIFLDAGASFKICRVDALNDRAVLSVDTQSQSLFCQETDNGVDVLKKGATTWGKKRSNGTVVDSKSATDTCFSSNSVKEYSCNNLKIGTSSTVVCPVDSVCMDGVCVSEAETISLNFKKGWNSYSVPFSNYTKLSSSCGELNSWTYDNVQKKYVKTNLLESMKGYWYYSTRDCEVTFQGKKLDLNGFQLKTGWNQIGSSSENSTLEDLLFACNVIHGPWKYSTIGKTYKRADGILPGEGFFVKVSSDCKLEG